MKHVRMMLFKIEAMLCAENAACARIAYQRLCALAAMACTPVRAGGEATIEIISNTGAYIRMHKRPIWGRS
jgi:hypothetical protein